MPFMATSCAIPAPIVPGPDHRRLPHRHGCLPARDPCGRLAGALALEEEIDQVAGGGSEDDPNELVALGGEPSRR